VDESYALEVLTGTLPEGREPLFQLYLAPEQLAAEEALLVIGEYCRPGVAQYLRFRPEAGRLVYAGAVRDSQMTDLTRIARMEIRWEVEEGDTLLIYEAEETEYANLTRVRLRRQPRPVSDESGWFCGLQMPLIQVLTEGAYTVYSAGGTPTTLDGALGIAGARDELALFASHYDLWPMLEELCVRSSLDVVVLGSPRPGAETRILAIEWAPDAIYLYETRPQDGSGHDWLPLERGPLFVIIVLQHQHPPLEDF